MDNLGKDLIGPCDQNQKLCSRLQQHLLVPSEERARFIDGVDDGPGQRKKSNVCTLERQIVVLPLRSSFVVFKPRKNHQGLQVDELVPASIDNAELKSGLSSIWRNNCVMAVNDVRGRTRKAGIDQARRYGKA